MRQKSFIIWAIALCLTCLRPAWAADAHIAALCDQAAAQAAQTSGVPLPVLLSIARVESGKSVAGSRYAWPWTINAQGQGYFFTTAQEALDFANAELNRGEINFDIGCFQVNLRWHARAFTSLEHALDPAANAQYAAQFLAQLYRELGDWPQAVAAYHSRTPKYAQAYLGRVRAAWAELAQTPPPPPPPPPRAAMNGFPLLQGGRGANGSIVPAQDARIALW